MGYLTPETIPTNFRCRVLNVPDDDTIYAAVTGALSLLVYASNWEQFGAITPPQMAAAMFDMFNDFVESECAQPVEIDLFRHEEATGVAGGGITANTDTSMPYNIADAGNVGNVTFSAGAFLCQPGKYLIELEHMLWGDAANEAISWLATAPGGTLLAEGLHWNNQALHFAVHRVRTIQTFVVATSVRHDCQSADTRATDAFGNPRNLAGHVEIYGYAKFTKLS